MTEVPAKALRRQAGVPWHERLYSINRTGVRGKVLLEAGHPQNWQYVVTMPPELAAPEHDAGTLFHWRKGMSGVYVFVPTGDIVVDRYMPVWTPEMDAALDGLSNTEHAKRFGLSVSAVSTRRYLLKKELEQ